MVFLCCLCLVLPACGLVSLCGWWCPWACLSLLSVAGRVDSCASVLPLVSRLLDMRLVIRSVSLVTMSLRAPVSLAPRWLLALLFLSQSVGPAVVFLLRLLPAICLVDLAGLERGLWEWAIFLVPVLLSGPSRDSAWWACA